MLLNPRMSKTARGGVWDINSGTRAGKKQQIVAADNGFYSIKGQFAGVSGAVQGCEPFITQKA